MGHLKELVRYIHLNPLRAGLVADIRALGKYPYCGNSVLMGNTEQKWQDTKYVLSYFGNKPSEARDLLCYWAVRQIGISCTELAKRLGKSQPAVSYAVRRGEKIAKKYKYQLLE
jgi:hypothetical protein